MAEDNFLIKIKKLLLTKEIFAAIIGGLTAGIIGFLSASLVNNFQHNHEINDQRNDAVIQLHREISENRFLLEDQLRKKSIQKSKLVTVIWDTKKYIIDFDKKLLMEGISLVYDEIRQYNEICDFISYSIKVKGKKLDDPEMESVKKSLDNIIIEITDHLKALETLTFQDLVKKGLAKPKNWEKDKMGSWNRKVLVPRIKPESQNN